MEHDEQAPQHAAQGGAGDPLPYATAFHAPVLCNAVIEGVRIPDHLEIWDPDAFEQYLNEQTADYETLAERVMGV